MGFQPDMRQEEHVRVETRGESMYVFAETMPDGRPGMWTWTYDGKAGCPAVEIRYDALARLVAAIAYNPSVIDAMGKEWRDALSAATALYAPTPEASR